jgi:hypothetical protein
VGGAANFAVDQATGAISIAQALDFEVFEEHRFVVRATDGRFTVEEPVEIKLTNKNEAAPVFDAGVSAEEASVSEDAAVGTSVAGVFATDSDTDDVVTYTIVGGDPNSHFAINSATGAIATAASLDREETETYALRIRASDALGLASFWDLQVTVTDVNDNTPVFTQDVYSKDGGLSEDAAQGSHVVTVKALDADKGINSLITYSLEADNNGHFAIDASSGAVTVL